MRRTPIAIGLALAATTAAVSGVLTAAATAARGSRGDPATVTPARASALGAEAYVYGYPLTEFDRTARIQTSVRCADTVGDAPVNTFSTATRFADPSSRTVVATNVDTLYSIAHLDLGKGQVVLAHPAMGKRYFVFELLDPYTNVIAYIGSRTTGSAAGRFAITWTGHPGRPLPGARVIKSDYRDVWVIGRTLASDRADQLRAVALMRRYTLTPPGGRRTFPAGCKPGKPISAKPATGLAFLDELATAMRNNPPPARDRTVLAGLRTIGVGPGLEPQRASLTPTALSALVDAVDQEAAELPAQAKARVVTGALKHHGWYTPPADIGNYGTDYTARAEIAAEGLGANTPAEAIYPVALTDATGQLLNGASSAYELTFTPGHLPPVEAFWSITMYSESGYLIPNSVHRYAIGPTHPPLRRKSHGDIVIILSHTRPGQHNVNWLPAPAAPFRINLRLYWPRRRALDGAWQPPPITQMPPSK